MVKKIKVRWKTKTNETVCFSTQVVPFICLPISSQSLNFAKNSLEIEDFREMNNTNLFMVKNLQMSDFSTAKKVAFMKALEVMTLI